MVEISVDVNLELNSTNTTRNWGSPDVEIGVSEGNVRTKAHPQRLKLHVGRDK